MELFGYKIFKKNELDTLYFNRESFLNYFFDKNQPVTIFDVGANKGQTIDYFIDYFNDYCIHAFEPGSDAFGELEKRYCKNQNITINKLALGKEAGFLELNCYSYSAYNSFYPINPESFIVQQGVYKKTKSCENELDNPKKEKVEISTIDEYFNVRQIHKVDIVKIDVQGFESDVLLGGISAIQKQSIDLFIVEITFDDYYTHATSFRDIENILLDNGYMLWDISHIYKDLKRGRTCWVDAVYVSKRLFGKKAKDEQK